MKPAAVVVGDQLNPLGIVRSLWAGGVPVVVIGTDPKQPAMRSRYGRKVVISALEGPDLIEALLHEARTFPARAILFLSEEGSVRTVSAHRAALADYYIVRLPPHDLLMALMHKQGFQELAERHGAPVPPTLHLQSMDDLPMLERLRYPCVLKPAYKDYGYGNRFKKAYVVPSAAEAARVYREIAPTFAEMVLQEWIDGEDHDIYFCLQYVGEKGAPVSSFTGRKIRAWPPHIGGTASCAAALDAPEEIQIQTTQFFRNVGFTGMGSMEFKRDSRDGRCYMVEPTVARTDFQEEVATINGVNIPLAAYCYECGLVGPEPRKITPARIWRDPVTDRWSRSEQGPAPDGVESGLPICDAYFRYYDPLPWFDLMAERIKWRLKRRLAIGRG